MNHAERTARPRPPDASPAPADGRRADAVRIVPGMPAPRRGAAPPVPASPVAAGAAHRAHAAAHGRKPEPTPRLLRAFVSIFEAASISGAARATGMSQPTMSDHLRQLRAHFGDRLFVRATGGLVATPRALELRPLVEELLRTLDALSRAATPWVPGTAARRFKVGACGYVQAVLLPPLDALLRRQAPGIALEIGPPGDPDADLQVVPRHAARDEHRLRPLFTDVLACAFDPAVVPAVDLATLCGLDHLLTGPAFTGIHQGLDRALAALGRTRRVAMAGAGLLGLESLLRGHGRLAILPGRLAPMLPAALACRPLPIALAPFEIVMAWPQNLHGDPAHRWFRAQVAAAGQQVAPGLPHPGVLAADRQ